MVPETDAAGFADFLAAHPSLLDCLYKQAQAARWHVSRENFAAALYASVFHRSPSEITANPEVETYLRGLHVSDLALACALRHGSELAWEEFIATYRPLLYVAARAMVGKAGEAAARELADSLYAELYGLDRDGEGRRPLLSYFHGRSKLATWLRAVLAQRYVDTLRATQRMRPLDASTDGVDASAAPLAAILPSAPLEDGDLDRQRLVPHLREAISECFQALAPGERLLLSLYYVQELTLAQIARLQGVHEATISRQIERLRRELRQNIERALLSGSAALSAAEVDLCFSYALEDWAFDLGAMLAPNESAQEEEEK